VIIPTYNRLGLLKKTLQCLDQQTYPSNQYEVIVVDDGSEDGTESYLRRAAAQGKLRYIRQENRGPAAARNRGVQAAQGEVVAFTDDDCLPDANWLTYLSESYTSCSDSPPVAVGGRVENFSNGHWLRDFRALQNKHHLSSRTDNPEYLDTANASFHKSVFLELGGFDESFPFPSGEDVDFGFRLIEAGYDFLIKPEAIVQHIGRVSLFDIIKQSFNRGRGNAYLKAKYPDRFMGPPSQGLRLHLRNFANSLLRWCPCGPQAMRPLFYALMLSLRQILFTVPELENFYRTYFRDQKVHYQRSNLSQYCIILYLSLEWFEYILQIIGQVIGTFSYTYDQICNDGEVPLIVQYTTDV
jgi:glycosyltransferase involved in cell wall biosynthesis